MARRTKISAEERKRRARDRWRLKHDWYRVDVPPSADDGVVPVNGVKYYNQFLPTVAGPENSMHTTKWVPPDERKPRRKPEAKRKPDPQPPLKQPQMDFDGK
jgi:hypothetical protein